MLNPFPQLLVFGFFAPTLLRLAASGIFFVSARAHMRGRVSAARDLETLLSHRTAKAAMSLYIVLEWAIALGLLLGFWTQVAALVGLVLCTKNLLIKRTLHELAPLSRTTYVLLGVVCLSLLLTGAGALAFDLPL